MTELETANQRIAELEARVQELGKMARDVNSRRVVELEAELAAMRTVGEPVGWKHDCAALLTNDVELWIDACPHCGKPRHQPVAQDACEWHLDDEYNGIWGSSCGESWSFFDGGPKENRVRICQGCGKQIAITTQGDSHE